MCYQDSGRNPLGCASLPSLHSTLIHYTRSENFASVCLRTLVPITYVCILAPKIFPFAQANCCVKRVDFRSENMLIEYQQYHLLCDFGQDI